jgi:hypothetical protein
MKNGQTEPNQKLNIFIATALTHVFVRVHLHDLFFSPILLSNLIVPLFVLDLKLRLLEMRLKSKGGSIVVPLTSCLTGLD